MEIKYRDLRAGGLALISYPRYADDRGWFAEIFNVRDFASLGLPKFVQDNVSRTGKRGVVRGLHFQAPPFTQAKLFRVVRGKAHNVAVDLREREPTVHAMELSPDDPWLLIPPGFAHGIQTLCDDVEIHFKVDLPFEASALRTIRFDDPDLGISWPIDVDESLLSYRDRNGSSVREGNPFHGAPKIETDENWSGL